MKYILITFCILFASSAVAQTPVITKPKSAEPKVAEDTNPEESKKVEAPPLSYLPRDYGIIEQTIAVPFKPVSVYALVEVRKGEVRQYHGVPVPTGQGATEVEAGQTVTVGSLIPIPENVSPHDVFHFTFFLANVNGEFAATDIRSWTWEALRSNSLTVDSLAAETARLDEGIPAQREANAKLEGKLTQIRDQASKIAGVDDILDLKAELESLKGFDGKKAGELDRLHILVKRGLSLPPPPQVDELRMELGNQLRVAARLTADADRLGMSQRDSAVSNYRRKLAIVKQTQGVNAQEVAQDILRLRKRRKELEARLNLTDPPESGGERDF